MKEACSVFYDVRQEWEGREGKEQGEYAHITLHTCRKESKSKLKIRRKTFA